MESKEYRHIVTEFFLHSTYTFAMKVGDLLGIQYVASRGVSTEQGAVQRILNKSRVESISRFVLAGNTFVNTIMFPFLWTGGKPFLSQFSV